MKSPNNNIPIYDFLPEDDLGDLPLRFVPLEVKNDYDFSEPHRHDYYEVFFFTKGGGTHLIDFVQHDITNHSLHLVKPGQVHLLRRELDTYGAVIHFSKNMALRLDAVDSLLRQGHTSVFFHQQDTFKIVNTLLTLLATELSTNAYQQEVILNYLRLLLLKGIVVNDIDITIPEIKEQEYFIAFQQLAEAQYRTGMLPAWYAQQLHITEKKLNEVCKRATGNTVSFYLTDRILLEAKRLLSHSGASIKEIGYYLGFDDPAYFTRFFRKNEGMTAGDFRSKYK